MTQAGDLAEARRVVENITAWLMLKEPFLALLLRRTTIAVAERGLAYTDGVRIYVSPRSWLALPDADRAFVLLHELMHIILRHVPRIQQLRRRYGLPAWVYNFVADAKANQEMPGFFKNVELVMRPITPEDVERTFGVMRPREKSFEEIIREIHSRGAPAQSVQVIVDLVAESPEEGERKGGERASEAFAEGGREEFVIQEGDEPAGRPMSSAEIEERVARKVVEVFMTLKAAGRDPGRWERLVSELLRPRVDWRRVLRSALAKGLGRSVRRTWGRPSRKAPGLLPGKELLGHGKIVVMVDVSGSISEKELAQFLAEAHAVAKEVGRVIVVAWDADVQGEFEIRRYADIRKIKVRGGGGTMIGPALKYVLEKHRDASLYVILSDWEIGDLDEVGDLLKKIADRTVAVSTSRRPPGLQFRQVIII